MLKSLLQRDQLFKNIFTLVKGTVAAQAISMLAQPFLRRVFTAEDFGLFALFIAAVSILTVLASGRYDLAIVLPKKESEAKKLYKISVIISLLFNVFLLLMIFIFGNLIIQLIIDQKLVELSSEITLIKLKVTLYLIPVSVFLMSVYNSLQYLFTRTKEFNKIVNSRISNASVNVSSSGGLGYAGSGFGGIIIGYVLGLLTAIVYLNFFIQKSEEDSDKTKKELMKEYIDFPTKSMGSGFLNIMASQLPMILIGSFFGLAILGVYELIIRVLNVPITMIGKSISQVFYQKISEDVNNEKPLGKYVRKFSIKLFLFMLIPMTIIFFFGEPLFVFAFGEDYKLSGSLAAYFAIFYLIRFVYYSQSTLYAVKRKINIEFTQNLIYLISQVGALLVGYFYFEDFTSTFILLAASGFLCYLFFTINLIKVAHTE